MRELAGSGRAAGLAPAAPPRPPPLDAPLARPLPGAERLAPRRACQLSGDRGRIQEDWSTPTLPNIGAVGRTQDKKVSGCICLPGIFEMACSIVDMSFDRCIYLV